MASPKKPRNGRRKIIFRAWITRKDGTRDYAKDHGLRAWRIEVSE